MNTLRGLKKYDEQVPDVNVKKGLTYNFFTRPVAKWSCSSYDLEQAVDIMSDIDIDDLDSGSDLLQVAMIMAIVYCGAILIPTIFVLCIAIKCRKHCCMRALPIVTLSVEFALTFTCAVLALVARSKYTNRSDQLKELDSAVNGCMDAYSDIPDSIVESQLESQIDEGNNAAALLVTFSAIVIIKVITVVTCALCAVCRAGKSM